MADSSKLQESLANIAREIRSESDKSFTGRIDVGIKMNQGGIDHISMKVEKNINLRKK